MPELSSSLRLKILTRYESPTTPYSRFEIRCARFYPVGIGFTNFFRTSNFGPRTSSKVWAIPASLAATGGIEFSFLSSGYLDVSVPLLAFSVTMCSSQDIQIWLWMGCPIRISTDYCLLTTPRGISLLTASFFGSWRQGIHRVPFISWPYAVLLNMNMWILNAWLLLLFCLTLLSFVAFSHSAFLLCSFQRTWRTIDGPKLKCVTDDINILTSNLNRPQVITFKSFA